MGDYWARDFKLGVGNVKNITICVSISTVHDMYANEQN